MCHLTYTLAFLTAIQGLTKRGARLMVLADRDEVLARGVVPMRPVPEIPEIDSPHGFSKITLTL
jgi:hypothetical protein